MVEMKEPETIVMLETAAGLVKATATCKDGRCEKVKLTMVPSFVHELDVEIDTPDWGRIRMDISYGGIFYALVDVRQIGLTIDKANAAKLVAAGMVLKDIVNRDIPVVHPEIPAISGVAYVMFRDTEEDGTIRTCTTMWPGRADRSPCGTGNSANLATLHARGKVKVGTPTSPAPSSARSSRLVFPRSPRWREKKRSFPPLPVAVSPSVCTRSRSTRSIRWRMALP